MRPASPRRRPYMRPRPAVARRPAARSTGGTRTALIGFLGGVAAAIVAAASTVYVAEVGASAAEAQFRDRERLDSYTAFLDLVDEAERVARTDASRILLTPADRPGADLQQRLGAAQTRLELIGSNETAGASYAIVAMTGGNDDWMWDGDGPPPDQWQPTISDYRYKLGYYREMIVQFARLDLRPTGWNGLYNDDDTGPRQAPPGSGFGN